MKIFFVFEDGKNIIKTAKYLSKLNTIPVSDILICTSTEKNALMSAKIIKNLIGVKKTKKYSWLNSCNYYADKIKCPFIIRKIDSLIIKNKKIKRMIFVTHLDEIKQILKWTRNEKYKTTLDNRNIKNGSVILMDNKKHKIKQVF